MMLGARLSETCTASKDSPEGFTARILGRSLPPLKESRDAVSTMPRFLPRTLGVYDDEREESYGSSWDL